MATETTSRRKGKEKYTVVFLPSDQSKKSRSFSVSFWGIIAYSLGFVAILVSTVLLIVVYTPVGTHLPISSPELERLYGQKVIDIQQKLGSLVKEVGQLQDYNQRLRRTLGEKMFSEKGIQELKDSDLAFKKANIKPKKTSSKVVQDNQSVQSVTSETGNSGMNSSGFVQSLDIKYFPLTMPVLGYETRNYSDISHSGIDIVAKEGSPVVAAASGNIIYADWTLDDGYMIILAHSDGFTTVYKHNKVLLKNRGMVVKRGETIALLGNTGRTSSGPHIHFEVWNNGIALNPMNYVITIQ